MKAKLLVVSAIFSAAAMQAQAASIFEVTAGANYMKADATAQAGEVADAQFSLSQDGESTTELYLTLEHGLPLLPNFRYLTNDVEVAGRQTLTQTYILSGQTYRVASVLSANYQYEYKDYSFYYELFDNSAIELDIGMTLKDIDATFSVANTTEANENSSRSASGVEAYLYTSGKVNLPLLNMGLTSVLNIQDGSNYDFEVALKYQLGDSALIKPYVQLGWKKQEVDFDDFDSLYLNHSWDAVFAGVGVTF